MAMGRGNNSMRVTGNLRVADDDFGTSLLPQDVAQFCHTVPHPVNVAEPTHLHEFGT